MSVCQLTYLDRRTPIATHFPPTHIAFLLRYGSVNLFARGVEKKMAKTKDMITFFFLS